MLTPRYRYVKAVKAIVPCWRWIRKRLKGSKVRLLQMWFGFISRFRYYWYFSILSHSAAEKRTNFWWIEQTWHISSVAVFTCFRSEFQNENATAEPIQKLLKDLVNEWNLVVVFSEWMDLFEVFLVNGSGRGFFGLFASYLGGWAELWRAETRSGHKYKTKQVHK